MLLPRILSGIVAIALALTLTTLGGWYFTAAIALLVILAQREYFQMVRAKGIEPAVKSTLVVSLVLLFAAQLRPPLADALFPLAGTFICFYLLFQGKLASIADISTSLLGLFYCGYLPSYWVRLRGEPIENMVEELFGRDLPSFHPWLPPVFSFALSLTLLVLACVCAADIGAYVMGRWWGKTKLSAISPKKTVEGAIAGGLACVAIALWGAWFLGLPLWYLTGAILGTLIALTTLLGDLTESLMKRDAGFKDSGDLIPGHGGILDRTDSYVFTAPLVYYFVTLVLPFLSQTFNPLH